MLTVWRREEKDVDRVGKRSEKKRRMLIVCRKRREGSCVCGTMTSLDDA